MALSLRDRQIAAIKRILNLNAPIDDVDAPEDSTTPTPSTADIEWKVLILDTQARNVISAVLRTNDLRAAGVTVHFNLASRRSPIPDTPGIYLIAPTAENLALVTKDLNDGLYTPVYVNFLSSVPRALLEDWGSQIASSPSAAENLAQIYDQYLNFVTLDSDQFSLNIQDAYRKINSPKTSDQELDELIDRIVSGLFSVVVTMAVVPIIRCPTGGAASDIAAKLDRKLRDHILNSKENLFSTNTASRPVLIIVDRNIDLCPMFSHSWIYQSLVYDVLEFSLNKVVVTVPNDKANPESGSKKQTYDLAASDYFWKRNAAQPFPQVADDVTNEWTKYTADADKITKSTGSNSIDNMETQFAAHLKGAISMLPELRERKATIESHMSMLESVMDGIKQRKLDEFFQLEEELAKATKSTILDIIKSSDKGDDPYDKLRLFLQWYLTTSEDLPRNELDSFTQALEQAGCDTTAVAYVKTVRQITRMTMLSSAPTQPAQASSNLFGGFSSLSSRVSDKFKEAGLGAPNFEGVLSGIKSYLPANKDLTLTKVVEAISDPQNATSSALNKIESWLYFDPRSANARGTIPPASQSRNNQSTVSRGIEASFGQRRQGYTEALVFPVGGGSMDEFGNLQAWSQRTSAAGAGQQRRVVYGSTNLYSARDFIVNELAPLGAETT
ncbi:hypothetical protein G6011_11754 [Alternaria panax]|uniref:Snare docking complex subunit n=1 Tax=Alternaria panax TaxID=48097 RepID=A0AAD4FCC6_9PLEO|nr:hypothetical protein G6011_11754 [Alternaria panax]